MEENDTRVLLLGTFELGRQPFGLAAAAAWLRDAGAEVEVRDLSLDAPDEEQVRRAGIVAFSVPMHTATRLALEVLERVRGLNARAKIAFFGLYAPVNEGLLRARGADFVLGGECEAALVDACNGGIQPERAVSLARLDHPVPDRSGLPALDRYAKLVMPGGAERTVGYVEASRGCKHRCRHCPIVPIYDGRFRIVERDVVLADVAQQVAAGAEHVTFGDPDFFNGVTHALTLAREMRARFPGVSWDATIKVEHLLRYREELEELVACGCAFVTTAVESADDEILRLLDKGHTREEFVEVLAHCRAIGLPLAPTFVPFTPWTTLDGYLDLLDFVDAHDLVGATPPVQLTIRLLVPAGSRLLELDETQRHLGVFDAEALTWTWRNPDPRADALHRELVDLVQESAGLERGDVFDEVRRRACEAAGRPWVDRAPRRDPVTIPFMTEPWY